MRSLRRLAAMQAQTEEHHTLTLEWYSPGGLVTVGEYKERQAVPEGQCPGKVQARSRMGGDTMTQYVKVDAVELPVLKGALHIPVRAMLTSTGALRVAIDWECVVVDLGPYDDTALLGCRYRVVDVPAKSHATARRLDVVDVTQLYGAA